jgi:hypothetical protein
MAMAYPGGAVPMAYRGAIAVARRASAGSAGSDGGHDAHQQSRENEHDNDRLSDSSSHQDPYIGRRHGSVSYPLWDGRKCY